MKIEEFARHLPIWCNKEEQELLNSMNDVRPLNSYDDHDQFVIEGLVRKSLVIKIESKNSVYVYPNV